MVVSGSLFCKGMKINLLSMSESKRGSTISFEYHCASIQHLGCMNVLAFPHICGPASMRYRSSETNHQYEY